MTHDELDSDFLSFDQVEESQFKVKAAKKSKKAVDESSSSDQEDLEGKIKKRFD